MPWPRGGAPPQFCTSIRPWGFKAPVHWEKVRARAGPPAPPTPEDPPVPHLPRLRLLAAVTPVLLAACASTAHAGVAPTRHQNDLVFDKREQIAEVPAGGVVTALSANCGTDYYVLSGSIRVDVVNGGQLSDVDVQGSSAGGPQNGGGPTGWFFTVVNNAPAGNRAAQIKLMISCIKKTATGGDGDPHAILFDPPQAFGFAFAANRTADFTPRLSCSRDETPFASIPTGAGTTLDPSNQWKRLSGMQPTVGLYNGVYFPGTAWDTTIAGQTIATPGGTLTPSLWCMRSLTGGSSERTNVHAHYIDRNLQTTSFGVPQGNSAAPFSQAVFCPSGYYGVAPTYKIPSGAVQKGLRLVGIGYQGDQMVFKFVNPNGDASRVDVGVLCVARKTSFDTSPTPGAGPGGQQLLTSERTVTLRVAPNALASRTAVCGEKSDDVVAGGISGAGAARLVRSGGGADPAKWPFTVRNTSGKPISVALNVKCLAPWAEGHTLVIEGRNDANADGEDACRREDDIVIRRTSGGAVSCLERVSTVRINHYHRLVTTTVRGTVRANRTRTLSCPAGYAALAPKVAVRRGQRVASTPKGRRWTVGIAGGTKAADVALTCLRSTTTPEDLVPVTQSVIG